MDLPNLFSSNAKAISEQLVLFVIVSDAKLQVSLLELSRSGVSILSSSKEFEFQGLEKCVEQTDAALQQLDKRSEKVNETIFAVNNSWVTDGEIVDEKKPFIKKLCDDLNLKPLGFIDITESIAQQKIAENTLFSGVILVFTKENLLFTLIHQGKIKKTEIVGSSIAFEGDFAEGIARLKQSIEKQGGYLPPKIILASFDLSESELHEHQQKIYEQNWEENTSFLQTPTVEIIPDADLLTDLSNEAGKSAAHHKGLTTFAMAASLKHPKPSPEQTEDEAAAELASQEFGFSDPLHGDSDTSMPEAEPEIAIERDTHATSFGIPIKVHDYNSPTNEEDDNLKAVDDGFMADNTDEIVLDKKEGKKKKRDWGHKKNTKWFVASGFGLGVLFLVAGIVLGAPLLATTEVEVVLNKKVVSKDIELTLDTNAKETDVEKLLIAADTVRKTVSDVNTIQTTGIKIVGEEATGKVVIYNKTDAEKTFSAGTTVKYGDLSFTLDSEVTVEPVTPKPGGEDYGSAEVAVTAAQIGAESNLAKESELTIASFDKSTYSAYVKDDDFTGGSSREVRVVAQKDLDELTTDLRNTLLEKVNQEFADESKGGTYILPSKSIVDQTSKFDAELDTEAESVSLDLEITVEAVSYTGGDLKPVAQEILTKELEENYELLDAEPQILSSPSQTDLDQLAEEAVVTIEANISSFAIPVISDSQVTQTIAGKPFAQAEQELKDTQKVSSVTFTVKPSFLSAFVKKVSGTVNKIHVTFVK